MRHSRLWRTRLGLAVVRKLRNVTLQSTQWHLRVEVVQTLKFHAIERSKDMACVYHQNRYEELPVLYVQVAHHLTSSRASPTAFTYSFRSRSHIRDCRDASELPGSLEFSRTPVYTDASFEGIGGSSGIASSSLPYSFCAS